MCPNLISQVDRRLIKRQKQSSLADAGESSLFLEHTQGAWSAQSSMKAEMKLVHFFPVRILRALHLGNRRKEK